MPLKLPAGAATGFGLDAWRPATLVSAATPATLSHERPPIHTLRHARQSIARTNRKRWHDALLMRRSTLLIASLVAAIAVARFEAAQDNPGADLKTLVAGLHGLTLHDQCTGDYAPQPDTCLHQQLLERSVTVGGKAGVVHDVMLRIQGLVEPTIIEGGEVPYADHPYYKVGGTIRAKDWSAWHLEVSNPKQTYWLNHYPKVSHTIYKEEFDATIPMAGWCHGDAPRDRWQRSSDGQRRARAARQVADHHGDFPHAARGADAAARGAARQSAPLNWRPIPVSTPPAIPPGSGFP